jgi:nitrogenase molybdenum-iron protein alpha/beta subunit
MTPDYTINDAFHDGFECGLLYILRYLEDDPDKRLTANDIAHLVIHLEEKKPWKSHTEWEEFILNNISKKYPLRKF